MVAVALALLDVLSVDLLQLLVLVGLFVWCRPEGALWSLDLSHKAQWASTMAVYGLPSPWIVAALALLDVPSVSLLQLLMLVGLLRWRWCPYPSSPPVCCQLLWKLLWMLLVLCFPEGAVWSLDLSQKAHWSSGLVAVALALLDVLSVDLLQLLVLLV